MELSQKSLTGIQKFFLFQVPMNIQKDWKAKLESACSFMLKYSKKTVCYNSGSNRIAGRLWSNLPMGPGSASPVVSRRIQSNLPFFCIKVSIALTPLSFTEQHRQPFLNSNLKVVNLNKKLSKAENFQILHSYDSLTCWKVESQCNGNSDQ